MKKIVSCILLFLCTLTVYSQEQNRFKPSGRIIARSFFDYSVGLDNEKNESGFDITRAFLGYEYQITSTLTGCVIIDGASGRSDSGKLEVYLRNAYLNWHDLGFDVNVGLTGLLQFNTQEDYWRYRYVLNSYQDLNKMGSSVDLGVTAKYKFNSILSADISLINGEGYKNISQDNSTKYALGVDLSPLKNVLFRAYADLYNESEDMRPTLPEGVFSADYTNQYTLSLFGGYQSDNFLFGAEYNKQFNNGFIKGKNYFGYSFYSSVKLNPKWSLFARYDLTDSEAPSTFIQSWNDLDGQLMITGVEFRPMKQLKVSPNIRNINPDRNTSEQYLYVNVEFNL